MTKMNEHNCVMFYILLGVAISTLATGQSLERVRRSTPTITEIYAFDHFVELVEKIERNVTGLHNVANHIRSLGYNDAYWQNLIGTAPALPNGILSSIEKAVLTKMVAHRYDGSRELGVVRLPSGETIAIGHVINGIAAGIYRDFEKSLKPWVPGATKIVDNLYAATLARDLAETALAKKNNPSNSYFGPGGSWKSDECPAIYTRTSNGVYSDEASDAELLGDVDGFLLGDRIRKWIRNVRLGQLLRMYYSTGVCFDTSFASCKRYTKFTSLTTNTEDFYAQVSGTAEALYLKNSAGYPNVKKDDITQISKTVVDQFVPYLKNLHGNPTCLTKDPGCELPAKLVFVMDESSSILEDHFKDETQFVSQIIDAFNISPRQTKVAAIEFASTARVAINLHDYGSKTRFKCAVKAMTKWTRLKGRTGTAIALDLAKNRIFLPNQKRDSSKQSAESNIVILLTDGVSNEPSTSAIYPAIRRIKSQVKDLTMIAVGVGNYLRHELNEIATDPDKHVFTASNFHELLKVVKALQNRTCTTPVKMDLNFRQQGNITVVTAFVSPGKYRYFILTSSHFFGVDIIIKITPVHGSLRLFASRTTETPGPNDYKYKLDPIPDGHSLQLRITNPCSGHSNATTCPHLYLGIYHAESVKCTCTER